MWLKSEDNFCNSLCLALFFCGTSTHAKMGDTTVTFQPVTEALMMPHSSGTLQDKNRYGRKFPNITEHCTGLFVWNPQPEKPDLWSNDCDDYSLVLNGLQ